MTKTGFVFANLFRKKTRTILTLLSVIMAFLLFGLLQSVNHIFDAGADFIGATRLMTQARVSFTQPLPLRMLPQLEAVPGVARVAHMQWFGGVWQETTRRSSSSPSTRVRQHDVYPEWVMPEAQWKAFANTRTGDDRRAATSPTSTAGRSARRSRSAPTSTRRRTAARTGPSTSSASTTAATRTGRSRPTRSSSATTTSTRPTSSAAAAPTSSCSSSPTARTAPKISSTVDKMFENSPDETKTQTEKDFNVGFIKQIGDIGLIVRWILFAVFFTLLLVVGNTMAQSVRERIPELAVLKTLGFSDGTVLGFVLAEAAALCLFGGVVGMSSPPLLRRDGRRRAPAGNSR